MTPATVSAELKPTRERPFFALPPCVAPRYFTLMSDKPESADGPSVPLEYSDQSVPPQSFEGEPKLARTMGVVSLTVYGVGDMLGAGIYALIGTAAGLMGTAVWLAFAGSMVAAMLTGLSYANIGSRYPRAAGAAYVTQRAYGMSFLSYVVGLAVTASGLTSMATGARAIAAALQKLGLDFPLELLAVGFLLVLAGVVFRGIRESTWMNFVCTAVEVSGLFIVIAVGIRYWGSVNYLQGPVQADGTHAALGLAMIMQGSVLTFFSFIGFEDILNVSEECKSPRRTVPIGLISALVIATLIYIAVSITAVSVMTPAELAVSKNALQDVVGRAAPWFPAVLFAGISIFAIANTGLLNYVMGSRMLYGMSRQGLLPRALGKVHRTRQTPHIAIAVLLAIVVTLAMVGNIGQLAKATSLLLLTVFVVVNIALIVLKSRPTEAKGSFEVPRIIPALGAMVCLALIVTSVFGPGADLKPPMIAAGIVGIIVLLFLIMWPTSHALEETVVIDDD